MHIFVPPKNFPSPVRCARVSRGSSTNGFAAIGHGVPSVPCQSRAIDRVRVTILYLHLNIAVISRKQGHFRNPSGGKDPARGPRVFRTYVACQ